MSVGSAESEPRQSAGRSIELVDECAGVEAEKRVPTPMLTPLNDLPAR